MRHSSQAVKKNSQFLPILFYPLRVRCHDGSVGADVGPLT